MDVSLVATIYNSSDTVYDFLDGIADTPHEIVLVDGGSTDGTWNRLVEARRLRPMVLVRRDRWTSRGKGRQIAIESSSGQVVLMLDANIQYRNLDRYVGDYIDHYFGLLVCYGYAGRPHDGGARHFVIGTRTTWDRVGGYRDLYAWEDVDLAKRAGDSYREAQIDLADATPLDVRGLASGESDGKRYGRGIFRRLVREAVTLRDQVRVGGVRKGLYEPLKTNVGRLK